MPADYDQLRYARPDLEKRESAYSDAFDFVIEVAYEVIRSGLTALHPHAVAYVDELFATGVPELQRLALEGIRIAPTLSADQKMRWFLSKRVIHCLWFRTETHKILLSFRQLDWSERRTKAAI
jgi:hypothetical protein